MTIEPDAIYLPIEVADHLRCGRATVYRLISSGAIASFRVGVGNGGKRVTGRAILTFLEERTEGGPDRERSFKYLKMK